MLPAADGYNQLVIQSSSSVTDGISTGSSRFLSNSACSAMTGQHDSKYTLLTIIIINVDQCRSTKIDWNRFNSTVDQMRSRISTNICSNSSTYTHTRTDGMSQMPLISLSTHWLLLLLLLAWIIKLMLHVHRRYIAMFPLLLSCGSQIYMSVMT